MQANEFPLYSFVRKRGSSTATRLDLSQTLNRKLAENFEEPLGEFRLAARVYGNRWNHVNQISLTFGEYIR